MAEFCGRIRIGCAGWNVPRDGAAQFASGGSHLERYSRVFNGCEINSSFYRPHKNSTWERWGNSVPAEFQFSVKAPRTITHELRLNCSAEILQAFLKQVAFLNSRLGPLLFQLPPSLRFEPATARNFLALLRELYSGEVVWEPRHVSWFDSDANDLLREFHVGRAAADPACVPAASFPGGFGKLVYFRLHGSPRIYYSDYSDGFLDALARRLTGLVSASVWCVFDNTAAGCATQNALQLKAKVQEADMGPPLHSVRTPAV